MKLYFKYFAIHFRSAMQYKTSFFLTVLGQFLLSFTAFLSIYVLMSQFHEVEGFSFPEVLLCFSVVMIAFSLAEFFVRGFDMFASMIGNGEFDRIMVRPRGEMFQVLASKIEFSRIGRLVQAVLILIYALPNSGVLWTADKVLTLIFMIICGALLFAGLFVIYASICFFTIEGLEFMNIFTDGAREFGQYPFVIYGKGILKFLTYVIPLALIQYYPFLYLIGRSTDVRMIFVPFLALLFLIPCFLFWKIGVKHYKSTGS